MGIQTADVSHAGQMCERCTNDNEVALAAGEEAAADTDADAGKDADEDADDDAAAGTEDEGNPPEMIRNQRKKKVLILWKLIRGIIKKRNSLKPCHANCWCMNSKLSTLPTLEL